MQIYVIIQNYEGVRGHIGEVKATLDENEAKQLFENIKIKYSFWDNNNVRLYKVKNNQAELLDDNYEEHSISVMG
jgi:hypothetical protein